MYDAASAYTAAEGLVLSEHQCSRLGDTFVNAELLRRGYATTLTIPPNDQYAGQFGRLEREAAAEGRGLWGECEP